jgi:DNA-binding response OmpR family regulator
MRIALCTGNPSVSQAVTAAVRGRATPPTICESGLQLLAIVRGAAADLVVLDLDAPGLNSLFLISAIQEVAPGLPIAVVSSSTEPDTRLLMQSGIPFVKLNSQPEVEVRALLAELVRRARHGAHVGAAR